MFWVMSLFRVDIIDLPSRCPLLCSQKAMILPGTLLSTQWSARVFPREGSTLARATVVDPSSVSSLLRPWWEKFIWKYIWQHLFIEPLSLKHLMVWAIDCIHIFFYKNRSCLELWAGKSAVPGLDAQESTQRFFLLSTNGEISSDWYWAC